MSTSQTQTSTLLQWFRADEELLASLRPGVPFNARASFQTFGELQFGNQFSGIACCCELPGEEVPRWEAALELRPADA